MRDFLTMKEVAELLGVHSVTVTRYCKDGTLVYYQVGARKRFVQKDIDNFIEGAKRNAAKSTEKNKDPFCTP